RYHLSIVLDHHRDLAPPVLPGALERIAYQAGRFRARDHAQAFGAFAVVTKLLALARIHAFGVLAHGGDIDAVIARARTGEGHHRTDVGVKLEVLAQGDVDRAEAFTDGCRHRPLEGDAVALQEIQRFPRQQIPPFIQRGLTGQGKVVLEAAAEALQHLE